MNTTKHKFAMACAMAAMGLGASVLAAETVLNIAHTLDVRGPNVLLRDLASTQDELPIEWRRRTVLQAPEPGKSKDIPIATIAYALQQYPDMHNVVLRGTSLTRIRRTETCLDGEPIALAVKRHIRQTAPWQDGDFEIFCDPPARLNRLPEGKLEIRVKGHTEDIRSPHQYIFDVDVEVDGIVARTIRTPARILPIREVWIAARPLVAGQILDANDLTTLAMPADSRGNSRIPSGESVLGMEITRSIKAGMPILRQNLLPMMCASRGDTISVTASAGGIAVTLAARALSSGRLGDVITCENINTKRRILVRLVNPKEASTDITPQGRTSQ